METLGGAGVEPGDPRAAPQAATAHQLGCQCAVGGACVVGGRGVVRWGNVCFSSRLLAGSNVPRKLSHLRLNELADSASYEVIWGIQSTKIDTAFGSNFASVMEPADIIDLVSLHEINNLHESGTSDHSSFKRCLLSAVVFDGKSAGDFDGSAIVATTGQCK